MSEWQSEEFSVWDETLGAELDPDVIEATLEKMQLELYPITLEGDGLLCYLDVLRPCTVGLVAQLFRVQSHPLLSRIMSAYDVHGAMQFGQFLLQHPAVLSCCPDGEWKQHRGDFYELHPLVPAHRVQFVHQHVWHLEGEWALGLYESHHMRTNGLNLPPREVISLARSAVDDVLCETFGPALVLQTSDRWHKFFHNIYAQTFLVFHLNQQTLFLLSFTSAD